MRADVAIIGAGIVGLAVADEARLRGWDIVCLDPAPGTRQSAGPGRILRYAHDSLLAARDAMRARDGWRRWEHASGRRLVDSNGTIVIGSEARNFATAMRGVGAVFEWCEQPGMLSGVAVDGDPVLYDPAGGTIDAEGAVEMLSVNLGDHIVREAAAWVEQKPAGATVHTNRGRIEATQVVVAAGTATAAIVQRLGIKFPQRTFCHSRFTMRWSSPPEGKGACFLDRRRDTPSAWSFYGVPLSPELMAVGGGWDELPFPSGRFSAQCVLEASWKAVSAWARQHAPGLDLREVGRIDCIYAEMPSSGGRPYRIDRHGPVVAIAGNALFKFAPLVASDVCDQLDTQAANGLTRG